MPAPTEVVTDSAYHVVNRLGVSVRTFGERGDAFRFARENERALGPLSVQLVERIVRRLVLRRLQSVA